MLSLASICVLAHFACNHLCVGLSITLANTGQGCLLPDRGVYHRTEVSITGQDDIPDSFRRTNTTSAPLHSPETIIKFPCSTVHLS